MSMTPDEQSEFLQIYLDETEEGLDALIETLLVLENDPQSKSHLNEAFRMVHTIKGAAGMMGFDDITTLTHQLESRFEKLRSGILLLDKPTVTLSLKCVDYLRACNEQIRNSESLTNPAELLKELRSLDSNEAKPIEPQPIAEVSAPEEPAPPEATPSESTQPEVPASEEPAVDEQTPETPAEETPVAETPKLAGFETPTYRVSVIFEPGLKLLDMKGQLVVSRLSQVCEVVSTEPTVEGLATLTGPVGFELVVASDRSEEEISEAADVHGVLRVRVVGSEQAGEPAEAEEAEPEVTLPSDEETATLEPAEPAEPAPAVPPQPEAKPSETKAKVAETVRVEIERLDHLLNLAGELVINKARFAQIAARMNPVFQQSGALSRFRALSENLRNAIGQMKEEGGASNGETNGDANGDWGQHFGELERELDELKDQAEQWEESRRYFGQMNEAIDQLSRVSENLQRGVLQTRMVPVAPLFNRFKRVVRDLSSDRDKKVTLEIRGEKTELDKRMIDELGDPLVHLIRNSIDHGMETTAERVEAGKPAQGTITLEASHSGNNIFIIVRDDGRGISVEKVRKRIVERELMSAAVAEALSDEQVIEYIWHPGFSTASQVTNISGRGVGMDIVKTRISELNGTVDVESSVGEGTTFTIRLPLTLAIIKSLLLRIGQVIYSVPIDDVREIVAVTPEEIVTVHEKETLDVRGKYIPVVSINDLFSWHSIPYKYKVYDPPEDSLINVLVLQTSGRSFGLRVDELLGGEEIVIKSLSENFISIRGLSGASILGDGTVSLLLDVPAMMNLM